MLPVSLSCRTKLEAGFGGIATNTQYYFAFLHLSGKLVSDKKVFPTSAHTIFVPAND